jgi:hypothetical protein
LNAPEQAVIGWAGKGDQGRALVCLGEEQRRQRVRGRPDRARSALTQSVKAIEAWKVNINAAFLKVESDQLRFLG